MPLSLTFTFEPLYEVLALVQAQLAHQDEVILRVPNPDLGLGLYPGECTPLGRHRPLQVWLDLAERLECVLLTPSAQGELVELTLRRVGERGRAPRDPARYSAQGEFQRIDKLEDPCFLEDALEALRRVRLGPDARVLDLGVNSGNELRLLDLAYPGHRCSVVGLDLDESALALARARFPQYEFWRFDANDLPSPALGRFDLILTLDTLQSSGVDRDRVFRALLRDHLAPGGALILGLPNSRYVGGRVEYGARMLNFRKPELSLLLGDLALYRRWLHKRGFRVYVTGKYELLLTAVPV